MPLRIRTACAAALLACGSAAASSGLRDGEPHARLTAAATGPLFGAHNAAALRPGDPVEACLAVTNAGSGRGRPARFAPSAGGPLAPHLRLVVTRGRGGGRSCDGFVADGRAYGLEAPGVLFRGRLGELPRTADRAVLDPEAWAPGVAHTYRFTVTLADDPAAEGLEARWDLRLAAEALEDAPGAATAAAASSSPAACGRLQLAGAVRGRTGRTLVRTVRVRGRVRSVLAVRVLGTAGAERLVLTTGLRVRGRTLVVPRWASVAYRVNTGQAVTAARRPFRVRVAAGALRPGTNRVTVRVRPRRGRPRTTTFALRATTTVIAGRRTCILGA
jgi:hypothetical protein